MTADPVAGLRDEPADQPVVERDYSSAVYGSLLVTTLIAVQWWHDTSAVFLGLSLLTSVGVFWLAHVWSTVVDRRVHGPIDRAQVVAIGRHEAPMLTAALVPALLMGLAVFEFATVDQAIALALTASIVQLFLWGLAVGRAAHGDWRVSLVIATVDCALGLAVVVLKFVIIH